MSDETPGDRLPPCENRGNCLCTDHGDAPPLSYAGRSPAEARAAARRALMALGRTRVADESADRMHAECRVLVFVDDVHLRFDDAAGAVHVRSASRVGRNDLGVNRRRLARLRREWDAGGVTARGPASDDDQTTSCPRKTVTARPPMWTRGRSGSTRSRSSPPRRLTWRHRRSSRRRVRAK